MPIRRKKSWFFGAPGSTFKKFSKNNEPDETMFKELFNSQTFPAELNDTAKTNEQGLSKIADDSKAMSMIDASFAAGEMTEVIVPHQMPEVYSDIEGGDAYDTRDTDDADVDPGDLGYNPTTYVGWGIQVEYLKRTIGSVFRRVYRVINTLSLIPTGFSILYTKCATGYETYIKPASADGSITITDNGNGDWDFSGNPTSGPAGDDAIQAVKSGDIILRGTSVGIVTDYSTAHIDVKVMQGNVQQDLTTFTGISTTPASNPATIQYTVSAPDNYTKRITITAINAGVDSGIITMIFDVDGNPLHIVQIDVHVNKFKENVASLWIDKGDLTRPPGGPSDLWFYRDVNTGYRYYYYNAAWHILSYPNEQGPTGYTTLTNAGLTLVLTNTSRQDQIIHVPGGVVLAGPITISTSGSFPDGFKFNVIFDGGFVSTGQVVDVLGEILTDAKCADGNISKANIHSLSDNTWKKQKIVGDIWELGSGALSAQTVGTGCDASGNLSVACNQSSHASGIGSFASGISTLANANYSTAMGNATHASGQGSMAINDATLASGIHAFASGEQTIASGENSFACNKQSKSKGINSFTKGYGSVAQYDSSSAFASKMFSVKGDAQELKVIVKNSTTDNTPTVLLLEDAVTEIEIPTDCTMNILIRITAVQDGGGAGTIGDSFTQIIKLAAKNISGVSSIVPTTAVTLANYDVESGDVIYEIPFKDAAFGGSVAITVAANTLHVTVTGENSKDIKWIALVNMVMIGHTAFSI